MKLRNPLTQYPYLLYLRGRVADIAFDFDGGVPAVPGDNTNKFGFVHTTGGDYNAGDIVFDDGTSFILIPPELASTITTRTAINGFISLHPDALYVNQAGVWVLKGGSASNSITIDPSDSEDVDIVSLTLSHNVYWQLDVSSASKSHACEISALEKSSNVSYTRFAILGDSVSYGINLTSDGSDITLNITNNEVDKITVRFKRTPI